jgi:predicted nucleic acid-binding protein
VRIYLDLCCLNRPFDDQTQQRVAMETEVLNLLHEKIAQGRHSLCASAALVAENDQNPNKERKEEVRDILSAAKQWVGAAPEIDARTQELSALGFRPFDAFHVASAEAGGCDRLVTCDDQFLKVGRRHAKSTRVAVTDPLSLASEVDF